MGKELEYSEQDQEDMGFKQFLVPDNWYVCQRCGRKQMVGYKCPHEGPEHEEKHIAVPIDPTES